MDLYAKSDRSSALDKRRQKNRESMRRSRQRQRDQLQVLRDAVSQLEEQYKRLRLYADQPRKRPLVRSDGNRKYVEAIELSTQLGAENLYLKASIQYQASWKLELRRVMETTAVLENGRATARMPSMPLQVARMPKHDAVAVFGFQLLTERVVQQVIQHNTRAVKRVQSQLLDCSDVRRNQQSLDIAESDHVGGQIDQSELFGWDLRRRVRGSVMDFVFTKRFHQLSIAEVMDKTWVNELCLKGAQGVAIDVHQLVRLQELGTHAYVLGRDVQSPDTRTTLLRYRNETPPTSSSLLILDSTLCARGVVIGTQSLNPSETWRATGSPGRTGPEPSARLMWAHLAHAIEMLQVSDRETGEHKYVHVRWTGTITYGSAFEAHRNAVEMVTTLMRWELKTIAPAIQLVASADESVKDAKEPLAETVE